MAEFAQEGLEKLLPAFEVVAHSKLITKTHVKEFIARCQRYEYRFQKRVKRANDFNDYIKYLKQFLKYWSLKLKSADMEVRKNVVSTAILKKISWLYRTRSMRSGRLDDFLEEGRFCASTPILYKDASIAYGRMLQTHNSDPKLFAEAAAFESDKNNSTPNARTLVQIGLRKFPKALCLWTELFRVEARYVQYIQDRRDVLLGNAVEGKTLERPVGDEDVVIDDQESKEESETVETFISRNDAVLNLSVLSVVLEEAETQLEASELAEFHKTCFYTSAKFPAVKKAKDELEKKVREQIKDFDGLVQVEDAEEDDDLFFEDVQPDEVADEDDGEVEKETKTEKKKHTWAPLPTVDEDAVKKMLEKSVLTEDFDKKSVQDIQKKTDRQLRRERKQVRESTKGSGWFNMPATEQTEENQRDLQLLQLRRHIDPTAHYRKSDLKVLPKYFQTGRVLDDHRDFYSGRLTKKQRKQTMVEELLDDYELLQKNKKRYTQIRVRESQTRKRKGVPYKKFSKKQKNDS